MVLGSLQRRAFSLIELVIVVVIIGIIAAIAIPRMSRGAAGAADSALSGNLAVLRNAVDLFATEHGGAYPTLANLPNALTKYSNAAGSSFQDTSDATHIYGPYLREVPPLPVGVNKGLNGFVAVQTDGAGGWIYVVASGKINANCPDSEVDVSGKKYNTY